MTFLDEAVLLAEVDSILSEPDPPPPELESWIPAPMTARTSPTVRPGAKES